MQMKLTAALLAAFLLAVGPAYAEVRCDDRAKIVKHLAHTYGETQRAAGVTQLGNLIEVFASPSGSWTILHTDGAGRSCYMAAGEAWRRVWPKPRRLPIHGHADWIMEDEATRSCCSPADCFALPNGSVRFTPSGWQLPGGVVWSAKRTNGLWLGRSRDDHFWVCWEDPRQQKTPRCLFTPRVET